jgi:hypothetical protein
MLDTIDYEALFNQIRTENEGLRLLILKMRSDTPSLLSSIRSWISDFAEDESNKQILLTFAVVFFIYLIVPGIRALCKITFGRFFNER